MSASLSFVHDLKAVHAASILRVDVSVVVYYICVRQLLQAVMRQP